MDGPPVTRRTTALPHLRLPLLLLLLVGLLLPSAASATAHVDHLSPLHRRLASTLDRRDAASATALQLSPRPTPSPPLDLLPSIISSHKVKPKPKLSYVRPQAARRLDVQPRVEDPSCLAAGTTAAQINALFASRGGDAGVLNLCPSTVYYLEDTIYFTAANQGLQTLGGEAVDRSKRAELRISNPNISTALISMNCVYCHNLYIADLLINGSRSAYGSLEDGGGLVEMGGTSQNHSVLRSKLFDTRGWTSLHFIEGSGLSCAEAKVVGNDIGPSGESYGTGKIADGVSLSCANSYVAHNTIHDATDGAIVIFSSPGSQIVNNTITASASLTLGGVNMVDYAPWNGDYSDVLVSGNTFTASGNSFKIGIAIGPAVWGDDVGDVNFGGIVKDNLFTGPDLIFGVAVSGVANFTIKNNRADSTARFGGSQTGNCHGISAKIKPSFAVFDQYKTSRINYGADANCWVAGTFQYLLCYEPSTVSGSAVSPAFLQGGSGCSAGTPSPVRPPAWKDSGLCLMDSDTRILDGAFIQTTDNSVDYCLDRCYTLQFSYAGVENSDQDARGDGYGVVRSPASCFLGCIANSTEVCGGPYYGMGLYEDRNQVTVAYDPFAGSNWKDSGYCLLDSDPRVLVGWTDGVGYMTPQYCQSQCTNLGYFYAGLEAGGQCYCSNTIATGRGYGSPLANSTCSTACVGDSGQTCGGDEALHLYYDASKVSKPVAPFTNSTRVSSTFVSSSSSSSSVRSSSTPSAPSSSRSASLSASSCNSPSRSSLRSSASAVQAPSTPSTYKTCPLSPSQSSLRGSASARQPIVSSSKSKLVARATDL